MNLLLLFSITSFLLLALNYVAEKVQLLVLTFHDPFIRIVKGNDPCFVNATSLELDYRKIRVGIDRCSGRRNTCSLLFENLLS